MNETVATKLQEFGIAMTEDELVQFLSFSEAANGELSEDMLDGVAGGGKIWDWIKDKFTSWFDKQSQKNANAIGRLAR